MPHHSNQPKTARPRNYRGRRAGHAMMTPRPKPFHLPTIAVTTTEGHKLDVPVRGVGLKREWGERNTAEVSMSVKFEKGGARVYANIQTNKTVMIGRYTGDTKGQTPLSIAEAVSSKSPVTRDLLDSLDTLMISNSTKKTVLPPIDPDQISCPRGSPPPVPVSRSAWTPPKSAENRTATRQ